MWVGTETVDGLEVEDVPVIKLLRASPDEALLCQSMVSYRLCVAVGRKTHSFTIVDMGSNLILFVQARRFIRADVEVRSDEPITGGNALAIMVVDIESHSSNIGELVDTCQRGIKLFGLDSRTVTNDMRSSLLYCANAVWHSHNSDRLKNSIISMSVG